MPLNLNARTPAHPPAEMAYVGTTNRKHTYRTGRRGNIWYLRYACPVCGAGEGRLANLWRRRPVRIICTGNRPTPTQPPARPPA